MSLEKNQRDKELSKLKSDYSLWRDRVAAMSSEFQKTYKVRVETLSMMLLRIIAYQEMSMEDYEKEFKGDIDPEDEMGHLIKMAHKLLDFRFQDEHRYLTLLEGFFSKVRGKILKMQRGDKVVYTMSANIDDVDAKSLSETADKIDELRKKLS